MAFTTALEEQRLVFPASNTVGIVTVKALRKEMKALEEAGDMFIAYQVDCWNKEIPTTGLRLT